MPFDAFKDLLYFRKELYNLPDIDINSNTVGTGLVVFLVVAAVLEVEDVVILIMSFLVGLGLVEPLHDLCSDIRIIIVHECPRMNELSNEKMYQRSRRREKMKQSELVSGDRFGNRSQNIP